jgi:transposase
VNYGTLLYDFTAAKVIDLLPQRSAEFLADWLRAHPGVKVISRDRGGPYAQGAKEGAPQAIQVADRFHLMENLGDCLQRIAQKGIRLPPAIEAAAELTQEAEPVAVPPATRTPTRSEQAKDATRQRRQSQQDAIRELAQQGVSIRAIAAQLHLHRKTVRRYLLSLPDNARPPQPSICDAYREHLQQRWQKGVHNAHQLYKEIRAQGYTGSESLLRRYLRPWRTTSPSPGSTHSRCTPPAPAQTKDISPRGFRRLVLKNLRTDKEEALLTRIAASEPRLATSISLAHAFAAAIHAHDVAAFDAWLDTAAGAGIQEYSTFVESLRRDIDAVHNGITLKWSQGPVEGLINRLKAIKRAMHGRGRHDLLRRRVLFHLPD